MFPAKRAGTRGSTLGVQFEAMRAGQDAGVPSANGWSGYVPAGWDLFSVYRPLFEWFAALRVPPHVLEGLVLIGEPDPDADPRYDAAMRPRFPPRVIEGK